MDQYLIEICLGLYVLEALQALEIFLISMHMLMFVVVLLYQECPTYISSLLFLGVYLSANYLHLMILFLPL